MRPRCVELHRVLKGTGSFYYHCDWHASHYVKVMLDQIFGENQFHNEIVWKRTTAKTLAFRAIQTITTASFITPGRRRSSHGIGRSLNTISTISMKRRPQNIAI